MENISKAFDSFEPQEEDKVYSKYLQKVFNSVFQYAKIKTKVIYEVRKLQKMKIPKEWNNLSQYDIWSFGTEHKLTGAEPKHSEYEVMRQMRQGDLKEPNYEFDFKKLFQAIGDIRNLHS